MGLQSSSQMVVKIRLSRFGNKHSPFYNIVVAQARYVLCFAFLPDRTTSTNLTTRCHFLSSAVAKHISHVDRTNGPLRRPRI